uniref:Uncharacterized protein n=1 Tax=Anguilla anguilla TaxID=7936 RepID=A0A0E9V7Y8_ANGAN
MCACVEEFHQNRGRSKIQCMKAFWEKWDEALYLLRPQDI